MDRTRRIRIGILGCSDIARRRFLPALLKSGKAELAAVASRDIAEARLFCPSEEYEPMQYRQLLASTKVELIYISLPNHLHEEWTLAALEQGKHVICEKPLGLSSESVERMARLAEKRKVMLYENMAYLHHPQHVQATALIAAGTIGRVKSVRAAFGFFLEQDEGFRWNAGQGGGSFHDQARYPLSTALSFLQGTSYRFSGHCIQREGLNVGMNVCGFTSAGESFYFSTGFEQQYECWYEVVGDKGKLRMDRAYTPPADLVNVIDLVMGREKISVPVPAEDHFLVMLDHVCGTILDGGSFCDAYDSARRLAQLAEQVRASCEQVSAG
jgi:predicted dehydrogenase